MKAPRRARPTPGENKGRKKERHTEGQTSAAGWDVEVYP